MRGQRGFTDKLCRKLDYHGMIERKPDERLRRQRRAEARLWFIDVGGRVRMARDDGELAVAVTLNEALKIARELKKEGYYTRRRKR